VPKSGLMVGLGETDEEVRGVINDLAGAGCDIVTMVNICDRPWPIRRWNATFPPPRSSRSTHATASVGGPHMYAAPLVRSSYNASLFAGGGRGH
jgi:lipoic acid synthetase